ncbi:MAG: replicative DNA helicase [candidate division Zixibacteria bacterium CG_4_9_14_3_um_filter_46_8]|nr:MAG: replicative DNA helicase [candidate division Zixibacteria bacterium CG_4_9_14_3_um_filter_46_8]
MAKQKATHEHLPPQAVEIEQAILGAMLIDPEAVSKAIETISHENFYREAHRKIFKAITELFDKGEPTDIYTLSEHLEKKGQLDDVGGRGYIITLTESVATSALVGEHSEIVLEKSTLRALITTATSIISECYDPAQEVGDLLDRAEHQIFSIRENRLRQSWTKLSDIIPMTFEVIEAYDGKEGQLPGVAAGFKELDSLTAGFQKSDLIVIASRPSMGKTAFSLGIAEHVGLNIGTVAYFSLEMSKQQLAQRMLCSRAKVSGHRLRQGKLKDFELTSLARAAAPLNEAPIFIDDSASIGVLEMKAKARRLKSQHQLSMVIIDYLQLMQGPKSAENRQQEIAYISRSLKAMAKELDVPVVALSQLSRQVEQRGGERRPQLADLRESGAIEQDADVVMFIYRPAQYGITEDKDGNSLENVAEVIISKQRNGPTGTIKLAFVKEFAAFYELDAHYKEPAMSADAPF